MSIPNRSTVGPAATRVLLTLLRLHAEQATVCAEDIGHEIGRDRQTVYGHLLLLRRLGLVAWEDHHKGTLRPAAHLVLVGEVA